MRTLVLDVVGLTKRQLGSDTPHLCALAERGFAHPLASVLPALTLSAQATYLTGGTPAEHGAVGNGWFFRELGEAWLWRQPNALVAGEKLYEAARRRDPSFTCAKLFWWWNMGAAVDWSITPRPFYPADGRKLLAVYGQPTDYVAEMEASLGAFPFFDFWGPKAGLASSEWIANATIRTLERDRPSLTLCYLPHLDYDHQRFGAQSPEGRRAVREVDALVGRLVAAADTIGAATVVLSEYGIESVEHCAHPNRALRKAGLLAVRDTPVGETLDVFASRAFAVADHQVAHVYVRDPRERKAVATLLEGLDGVVAVLDERGQMERGLWHERSGDLVLVAGRGTWFSYYYWLDDARAPDFAPTVDIHRKPGYDPCELFVDPKLRLPALRVARRLLQKSLGMRYLMDVIPLEPSLVKGSHGRIREHVDDGPVLLASEPLDEIVPFGIRAGGIRGGSRADEGPYRDELFAREAVDPTSVAGRLLALLER